MRVLVLGGGVAGSSTAILLCRQGHDVDVVERAEFPRFSIGESISPAAVAVVESLGISRGGLDEAFQRKLGTQVAFDGVCATFNACNGLPDREWPSYSYNVERARFDALLLTRAQEVGARLHMPVRVLGFDPRARQVTVTSPGGGRRRLDYELLVDATGSRSPLIEQLGLREFAGPDRSMAVFGHFEGAIDYRRLSADHLTAQIQPPACWLWAIPLAPDRISIGIVDRTCRLDKAGFLESVEASPLAPALVDATPSFVRGRTVADYAAARYCGEDYFFVGDSAFFVDPIFSSGVTAALKGAEHLVQTVLQQSDPILRMQLHNRYMHDYYQAIKRQVDLFYEAIRHPLLVRTTLRWWNQFDRHPMVRHMQDWGNGAFNEHQLMLGLWSSAGSTLGRLMSRLGA